MGFLMSCSIFFAVFLTITIANAQSSADLLNALGPIAAAESLGLGPAGALGLGPGFGFGPGYGFNGFGSGGYPTSLQFQNEVLNNELLLESLQALQGGNYPNGYPGGNYPNGYPGGNYQGGYYPGGNYPGGNYPGGNYPGGNYPGSNYPGGNFPGGNYPGGNYPGGNYPGGNYPGGNYPGGYNQGYPQGPVIIGDNDNDGFGGILPLLLLLGIGGFGGRC